MEQRLVFFDLETGGLDPKRHPIIQIAAIAVDSGLEVLEAFEAKIQFDKKKASARSLRKNHYNPGVWAREAREPREIAADFSDFLRRHATVPAVSGKGESYRLAQLVAHNAAFDGPFLFAWFATLNQFLPARRQVLCTLQLALWYFVLTREAPPANHQLATLCAHFCIPFHAASAHEALADAAATVGLFRALTHSRRQTHLAA
jgi:DNA polymerase III epsilon subunit-like protein